MGVIITDVQNGSSAKRARLVKGDVLLSINQHDIADVLDYKFYASEPRLSLTLSRKSKIFKRIINKRENEDIGLVFETYLMDKQRSCKNKCIFCFIDQLPKGMRQSLYFKDDDSRLSFLFGNYITLTNLTEREIERIIEMHISPINISVHTTNPELRCKMMNNRFAGERLDIMHRFADAGIKMNCQLVLCPNINDGQELVNTMNDLAGLYPAVESVACVPVGLTNHRQGLAPLHSYTKQQAASVVKLVQGFGDKMLKEHDTRIFYPADEFYLKAEMLIPSQEYYEEFLQLENGVGLTAYFETEFSQALNDCDQTPKDSSITVATGVLAYNSIMRLVNDAKSKWNNLDVNIVSVQNRFFGNTVNIAGLITGKDLINQLKGKTKDYLLIPSVMLRREGDLFLDDVTVEQVSKALNTRVVIVPIDGREFVHALLL